MKTNNDLFPDYFPERWADSYGQDEYGLWQGVECKGVGFRFRWMPPGFFMMGSPENEPERIDWEGPQHLVRFRKGFWLAETACSKELWQSVMGEENDLSRFKVGQEYPVENVDWETAQKFIAKLNELVPGLAIRLPSEAEWEYGCRAGTTTSFWFGDKLASNDANYNGNKPYNNGQRDEYRERTVPVKYFVPNPWGLYQMHGNVWEWCQDEWHGNYKFAPDDGSLWEIAGSTHEAVCRGGSWTNSGKSLRSACRSYGIIHIGSGGFRLARNSESR